VNRATRHRQRGITVIGFVILAVLFGVVGLAAIKVLPMYISNMRLSRVLDDTATELGGKSTDPGSIRREIYKRFSIEDVNLPNGQHQDRAEQERLFRANPIRERVPYIADVWLLIVFDKQVEIRR
jgi:hypothetical protein